MNESTPAQAPEAGPIAPEAKPEKQKKPPRTPAQKRRRRKRILRAVIWLVVLGVAAFFAYRYYVGQQEKNAESGVVTYSQAPVLRGSLEATVYGTGMIAAASQPNVMAETDGTLRELRVSVGDAVRAGQILAVLENSALDEEVRKLEYDLWEVDSTITNAALSGEVTSIKAPTAGRVMRLYAQPGDDALAVYRENGSVALLSTDGRMKVTFSVSEQSGLALGDAVRVAGEGFARDATVTELFLQGTQATVTILDDTLPLDAPVTIQNAEGETLGEGALQINKPMAVSAFGGTVKEVRAREGDQVSQLYTLYTLEDAPNSLEMEKLRIQREEAAESLKSAIAMRENLMVVAPADGVMASVAVAEGDEIKSGTVLASLLEGEDMVLTIAVDELDVVQVEAGQPVSISVDALPDLQLTGEVEKIAPVGSGSGGVSSYDVMLNFTAAGTGVRVGMNASGEVRVGYAENTLYIPVEAVMTIGNESYVMVAEGTLPTFSGTGGGQMPEGRQEAAGGAAQDTPPGDTAETTAEGEGAPQTRPGGMPEAAGMMAQLGESGEAPTVSASEGGGASGQGSAGEGRRQMASGNFGAEGDFSARMGGGALQSTGETTESGTLRAVTTGLVNDTYVEILSGLSEGEIVLYQGGSSSSNSFSMMGGGGMAMTSGGGATTMIRMN